MDAELKLINMMQIAGGRHADLRTAFRKFRQSAREAFQSNVRYAPLPVVLHELTDGYKFAVECAGRAVTLVLSLRLDESDTPVGQISCFMPRMEGAGAPIILGRFGFTKQGDTTLDAPDQPGEKINVFVPASAAYVILHCLRLGLKRDWE